jgi:hypothetical protein
VIVNPLAITLNSGWNMISIPNFSEMTSIEDIFGPIINDIISIWAYDNGTWKVYGPGNICFSDLSELESGKGVWMNMKKDVELVIPGSETINDMKLAKGWNLVGYNSSESQDISEVISSIDGNLNSVWAYKDGKWHFYDPENPGFSDLATMESGYGYWINVSQDCIWSLP